MWTTARTGRWPAPADRRVVATRPDRSLAAPADRRVEASDGPRCAGRSRLALDIRPATPWLVGRRTRRLERDGPQRNRRPSQKNGSARSGRAGNPRERPAVEAVEDPIVEPARADLVVEAQRELVPIERRPLEPRAPTRDSDLRDVGQQRGSDARAAVRRRDVQVLEPDPRPRLPRREGGVEQGEAGRCQAAAPGVASSQVSAITASADGAGPNSASSSSAGVPVTCSGARSYSASSTIQPKISSTSSRRASRMRTSTLKAG